MSWDKQRRSKEERLNAAAALCSGKTVATENIVKLMEAVIHPGDKVVLEGDNQKQAAFLAASLAEVDPKVIHDLTMIIPSISRSEHLDYFEKGIASTVDFAFAGTQAQRLSEMLAEGKVKIGNFNTYLEIYARLFVDLIPNVCLVAADKADRDGNLFTGYSTEETPTLVEAAACKSGIVIAQVNEIVEDLPRVDIPGGWVDFIVPADKPYPMEPLFTRDPQFIKDADILMGMMVIKGIYAKHGVQSLNHGIGFNGAAIELLLPTYGEQLGLKGNNFVPELDAIAIGRDAGMEAPPIMVYGEDVSHTVTEQGIAYCYMAEDAEERRLMLASIAQGTPFGEMVTKEQIEAFRKAGKVAYPEDLGIDRAMATKDLLACKNLEEIAECSGGLYVVPEKFRKKD